MPYDDANGNHLNGVYLARPVSPEGVMCEASTGTPQVAVEFELLNDGYVGDRITWYGFLTPNAMERTIKALRLCGWKGANWKDAITLDPSAEVDLDIAPDTYNGRTKSKVNWVNRPGETGGPKPMDPAKRAAFAAKMNGFLLKDGQGAKPANGSAKPQQRGPQRQAATAPPTQGATPAALGVDENDIPFALLVTAGLGVLGAVATFGTAFGIA